MEKDTRINLDVILKRLLSAKAKCLKCSECRFFSGEPSLFLGSVSAWLYRCLLSCFFFFFLPQKKHDRDGDDEDNFSHLVVLILKRIVLSGAPPRTRWRARWITLFSTDHLPSTTAGSRTESDRRLCCRQTSHCSKNGAPFFRVTSPKDVTFVTGGTWQTFVLLESPLLWRPVRVTAALEDKSESKNPQNKTNETKERGR